MRSIEYVVRVLAHNTKPSDDRVIALGNVEFTNRSKHFNDTFLCRLSMPNRRVQRLLPRLSLEPVQVDRMAAFRPELLAERINFIRSERVGADDPDWLVRPSECVPAEIRRAIAGEVTGKERAALKRPRVILSSPLTSEDPRFEYARAAVTRRRGRPGAN